MSKDIFRKEYTPVSEINKKLVLEIKQSAEILYEKINILLDSRETSIAKTKLEESVMWAVKSATDSKNQITE